jgi:deazaflavin-dependent oxidoreductase (nitroreductase family)
VVFVVRLGLVRVILPRRCRREALPRPELAARVVGRNKGQGFLMNAKMGQRRGVVERLYQLKRWMYRTGRPGWLARAMNRVSAVQFSAGLLSPARAVTLEVPGRRTGRVISFPLVVAEYEGGRYLVSMLGKDANWVHNVRAAGGRAVLRRGHRESVQLQEVESGARAPILRRYVAVAPGARPHVPVDRHAPLEEFERIAEQYPVFQITSEASTR